MLEKVKTFDMKNGGFSKQYIMTAPRFVLQKPSKRSIRFKNKGFNLSDMTTAFVTVYKRYLCIFLIVEPDMIAAHFNYY